MKYIRGFLMAWGNFTAIPCPYGGWHEDAKRAMLCMLPLVGLILGVVTMCVWRLLDYIGVPPVLTGALVTAVYFLLTGFIHLDGFMDCSDAILSRRPELAERQRILKDPAVGAFAVICVVLMFLVFTASVAAIAQEEMICKGVFLISVMTVSRCVAANSVLDKRAMETSQYASFDKMQRGTTVGERTVLLLITAFPLIFIGVIVLQVMLKQPYDASVGIIVYIGGFMAADVTAETVGVLDRRNLGGMNGDIAGHMITMSETMGVLAAALLTVWC